VSRRFTIVFACLFLGIALGSSAHALELPTENAARLTGTAVVAQDYAVGYLWKQDADGTQYGPYAGLLLKQKLYENFMADLAVHLYHTSSSDSDVTVYLDRAEASYHSAWLTLAGGRREIGAFLSPGSYFGSYLTMGERTVDMVSATLPFRLFADVPDADAQVTAPYNALSLIYIPNLFSTAKADLDGQDGIILAQLRVKFGVSGSSSDLILNYSRGLQDYFLNSSLSTGGGVDGSYSFAYGFAQVWADVAVQDLEAPSATSVAAFGLGLDIGRVTFGLFQSLDGEYQLPLGSDPNNPFTGGYPQDPTQAELPQSAWFVQLVHRTNARQPTQPARLYYGLALTNSVGDYTLSRLREGSISVPVSPGFGQAPRVEFLPFRSSDYPNVSGLAYAGYEF
jgi:hypothetical protein